MGAVCESYLFARGGRGTKGGRGCEKLFCKRCGKEGHFGSVGGASRIGAICESYLFARGGRWNKGRGGGCEKLFCTEVREGGPVWKRGWGKSGRCHL